MNLELSARPTQLNPRRLGLLLSIGLVLATLLSSVSAETGVVPLSVPPLVQLGLFGIYFLSLLACLRHKNELGQLSFLACLGTYGLLYLNYNLERPASCFLVFCLLGFAAMASLRLKAHEIQNISFEQFFHQLLLHTSLGCSGLWLYVFPFRQAADDISLVLPLCASLLVAVLIVLHSTFQERKRRWIVRLLSFLFLLAFFGILWLGEDWTLATLSHRSGLFPACGLFLSLPTKQIRERLNASIEAIFFHPEGSILVTFLALCCLGTFLLVLPSSSRGDSELSFIDAAFTAVSAVCVTGLVVKDTALDFSLSGQIIILCLIQAGGLGIMFLSALALFFIGQRVSLRQESALFSVLGQRLKGEIRAILKRVLLLTFAIEALGAIILTLIFKQTTEDWGTALWQGVFTAISAFCNAGFALHSQNLIPFRENHLLVHTVAVLIILGGLSPGFILSLPRFQKTILHSVQLRMILWGTAGLLVSGTLFLLVFEWERSLADLSPMQKWTNAWFQSVTTRTAGFNTIEMGLLSPASQLLMMCLMFVGGSPGGTAGGIKTTTFLVLLCSVRAIIKGDREVLAFHRRLPMEIVLRASGITLLSLTVALLIFLALLLTQELAPFPLLFEVFSALGTVGLSLGLTPELNAIGKFLIMCCMYIGRVGPLTIALYLIQPSQTQGTRLPEEAVSVG